MERDTPPSWPCRRHPHFNPRAPHGARHPAGHLPAGACHFNPRAPHGARPKADRRSLPAPLFQSTRSAWSATSGFANDLDDIQISIHALRMERDPRAGGARLRGRISIHALRMERDVIP